MKNLKCVFLLFVFVLAISSFAFAKSDLQNVSINGDTISWSAFEGAETYVVRMVGKGSMTTNATSLDLKELGAALGANTGVYTIEVKARDASEVEISNTWSGQYNYTSDFEQLSTPTGLVWDNLVAVWNSVQNAESYSVFLLELNTSNHKYESKGDPVDTTTTSYDFTYDSRIIIGNSYMFCVKAKSTTYPSSEPAYSDGKEIFYEGAEQLDKPTNLKWNELVAEWDTVAHAESYEVLLYENTTGSSYSPKGDAVIVTTNSYDFTNDSRIVVGNKYLFGVKAKAVGYPTSEIEVSGIKVVENPAAEQLLTPTGLNWDGKVAKWNQVPNATSYVLFLFIFPADYSGETISAEDPIIVSNNQYDFSDDERVNEDNVYIFKVIATANGFIDSELSEQSPEYRGSNILGNLQNVHSEGEGVIAWDAYDGATNYYFEVGEESGYTNGATSINIFDYVSADVDSVRVLLVAVDSSNSAVSKPWEQTITITHTKKGDIDKNGAIEIIDVRLLLQAYINSTNYNQLTDDQKGRMDIDDNRSIDIVDVRLLLQIFVGQH